jgi:outer membrane protein assembly factor BamB
VSPDGSAVFVTGSTPYDDYATEAYQASMGSTIWARRYDGPGLGLDKASSVAVSPDGTEVFVTGASGPNGLSDYATLAYDASSGTTIWTRRYDGPASSDDRADSVAVSPDSTTVFVTRGSSGSNGRSDYATLAYDAPRGRGSGRGVMSGHRRGRTMRPVLQSPRRKRSLRYGRLLPPWDPT